MGFRSEFGIFLGSVPSRFFLGLGKSFFNDMRTPTGNPRHGKNGNHQVARDSHYVVSGHTVEIHMRFDGRQRGGAERLRIEMDLLSKDLRKAMIMTSCNSIAEINERIFA